MEDVQSRYLAGLKAGDKSVFEEIYQTYYSPLCYYCLRFVGSSEEAEEIVQSLFLKIWIKRTELDINVSIKSYLYRSVQNYALNYINQQKKLGRYKIDDFAEHVATNSNGQGLLEEEELKKTIQKAIEQLPERRRMIFELSRFSEMRYQQIADHLDISVKTVESQMAKALKSLRVNLKDYLPVIATLLIVNFFNHH